MAAREEDYYSPVKQKFTELFAAKGCNIYLETTFNRKFSNKLKSKIPDHRHMIFYFLRDVAPDITGFVSRDAFTQFVVIEVKNEEIKLDHIYQARKYAELFDARFAFLVSTKEIPDEIRRLSKVVYPLLSLPAYRNLMLVHFDEESGSLADWCPEDPSGNESFWR